MNITKKVSYVNLSLIYRRYLREDYETFRMYDYIFVSTTYIF